jgi:Single-stranded DNA-specific exonuclease
MINDIIGDDFNNLLKKGVEFFKKSEYMRLLVHYDGDGTSAAVIMTKLCVRNKKNFHLGFIKDLSPEGFTKRIEEEQDLPTIIVDAGSDQIKFLKDHTENIMVLDHHYYSKSDSDTKALNINARDFNIDGTREACGATMAFLFAMAVDEENKDLIPYMLSGCIADKQDMGGFRGINQTLLEKYGTALNREHTISLAGQTVLDAIVYSIEPFFKGLTGAVDNTRKALEEMKIDADKGINELTNDEKTKLTRFLTYKLSIQGCQSEAMSYIERDEFFLDDGLTATMLSRIIDANSKSGDNNLPVEYFLGNTSLRDEMIGNLKKYDTKLIDYILRSMKSMTLEKNIQFFMHQDPKWPEPLQDNSCSIWQIRLSLFLVSMLAKPRRSYRHEATEEWLRRVLICLLS